MHKNNADSSGNLFYQESSLLPIWLALRNLGKLGRIRVVEEQCKTSEKLCCLFYWPVPPRQCLIRLECSLAPICMPDNLTMLGLNCIDIKKTNGHFIQPDREVYLLVRCAELPKPQKWYLRASQQTEVVLWLSRGGSVTLTGKEGQFRIIKSKFPHFNTTLSFLSTTC